MIIRKIFFALLLVNQINVYADPKLPGQCEAALPKVLKVDLLKDADVRSFESSGNWGQSNKSDSYWNVYSDRENNVTYNSPNKTSGRFGTLDFNEAVRIAKIENGFALVYKENKTSSVYPKINNAETKGWVPMENLLLWSSCPTNDKGIYHKALPVINIDEYIKAGKKDLGKVYKNPEGKSSPTELKTGMDFYFVMKTDKSSGLVLLAKECKMSGYTSSVLYGWVSTASYVSWDQRSCLEPNWTREAAEKFEGQVVKVYRDVAKSKQACDMPLGRANKLGQEITKYRMYPDEMRYPVLGNELQQELYKVTAFATPEGKSHIATIRKDGDNSKQQEIEKVLKEQSVINLIVVIDGTSSMKDFYDPTQKIIQQANDYFSKQAGNVVKVGVVIYRDYADGQFLTEYVPMTSPKDNNLANFLKTGGKYGIKSVATSATEAVYKGLEVALDAKKMGYSSKNSNIMFVIGDCGNDPEDNKCLTTEQIVNKCVENRIQLSTFQVYNGTSQAYKLFRSQLGEIVRESLKKQYGIGKITGLKAGWVDLPDGYEFKTNLPDAQRFYIGNTRNAPNGEKMPVSKLYDIVKDSYIQFNTAVEARKAQIYNVEEFLGMIADESVTERTAAAAVNMDFIENAFDKEALKVIKRDNMLLAFEGYAPKQDKSSGYDYWQPVVYISEDEFKGMMRNLQPVMAAANEGSEDRKPYVEAMKALTRIMVPDITEAEMNNKSTTEIMALVAGLPVTSEALQGRSLIQIQDNKVVGQEEFDGLIATFQKKYRKLDTIKDQGYKYSIKRNNTTWYWIPVQDLP